MFKAISSYVLAGAVVFGVADTAFAQRQSPAFGVSRDTAPQTINFTIGGFFPRGEESRVDGDVLVVNCDRVGGECSFLDFDTEGFSGVTFGGEYLFPIGNYIEAGAGLSWYKKSVPSRYAQLVADDPNTPEIEEEDIRQDLKLQIVPLAFTVRVLPLGQTNPIQPYVGAGLGVFLWKYDESGEFVDGNNDVFRDTFEDSGSKVGPVILAGVRFAADSFTVGGEFRWQRGDAELDPEQFFAPSVDLGGYTLQATFGLRFD